jgi:KDO2-lipid IV(A) lauroyltransferase
VRHRRALGIEIVPLRKGTGVSATLADRLRENWVVGLVADRNLSGRGVEVRMFGRRRLMPPGPALLSLRTGAPLFPAEAHQTEGGWSLAVGEPLTTPGSGDEASDVAGLTQRLADAFERSIAADPTDWHMFQPAW